MSETNYGCRIRPRIKSVTYLQGGFRGAGPLKALSGVIHILKH